MEMEKIQIREVRRPLQKKKGALEAAGGSRSRFRRVKWQLSWGKSGSGKSTLLNILGGMMSMDSGGVFV